MLRRIAAVTVTSLTTLGIAAPALACGGLIAPNGAVKLLRTSTLAAYHDGIEHYVTSFEFAGGGAEFGSIVPLPGIPSRVIKGGDWTLQRLAIETQQQPALFAVADAAGLVARSSAQVILEKKIAALDVTILKGGGDAVGRWAVEHGFDLPPDAPEVLDFYASRSPIFMAVAYDPARARDRGFAVGDGTPVHVVIPTSQPWVPLRILGLGRQPSERVEADVYLLTDSEPAMLPAPGDTMSLEVSAEASRPLLADLRSDRGMRWVPDSGMWLSYLRVDAPASRLRHDLALDVTGLGMPSPVAAGLRLPTVAVPRDDAVRAWTWVLAALLAGAMLAATNKLAATRR